MKRNLSGELEAQRLRELSNQIGKISWGIEQVLFKMRVSSIGSGIEHRVVEDVNLLDAKLETTLADGRIRLTQLLEEYQQGARS